MRRASVAPRPHPMLCSPRRRSPARRRRQLRPPARIHRSSRRRRSSTARSPQPQAGCSTSKCSAQAALIRRLREQLMHWFECKHLAVVLAAHRPRRRRRSVSAALDLRGRMQRHGGVRRHLKPSRSATSEPLARLRRLVELAALRAWDRSFRVPAELVGAPALRIHRRSWLRQLHPRPPARFPGRPRSSQLEADAASLEPPFPPR